MKIIILEIIQFLAKLATNAWVFAMFVVENEDVVRILYGASFLAVVIYLVIIWTKFLNSSSKERSEVVAKTGVMVIAGCALVYFAYPHFADSDELAAGVTGQYRSVSVELVEDGGMYRVPVLLNDSIVQYFILDSGASDLLLTPDVFSAMCRSGAIAECNGLPVVQYTIADGNTAPQKQVTLSKVEIGGTVFNDVKASVSEANNADLLLGQSILGRVKSYHIDNKTHILKMYLKP